MVVIAPAIKYFEDTMEGKRGAQLARMKAVRFLNPLHAMGNLVTEADIDGLSLFKFYNHPKVGPAITKMKSEIATYNSKVKSIKPLSQRRHPKTQKDTFDMGDWWRANGDSVPAFKYVLRAVLTNSPNSIPPERVFSILNNTFDDDQHRALADYMELSLQLQYNERSRKKERSK